MNNQKDLTVSLGWQKCTLSPVYFVKVAFRTVPIKQLVVAHSKISVMKSILVSLRKNMLPPEWKHLKMKAF